MESIKRAFFLTLLILVCSVVQAQSLQVSGTIVSKSDGQPVIGATILLNKVQLMVRLQILMVNFL